MKNRLPKNASRNGITRDVPSAMTAGASTWSTFEALGEMLRHARRNDTIAVRSRRIIVLEYQAP